VDEKAAVGVEGLLSTYDATTPNVPHVTSIDRPIVWARFSSLWPKPTFVPMMRCPPSILTFAATEMADNKIARLRQALLALHISQVTVGPSQWSCRAEAVAGRFDAAGLDSGKRVPNRAWVQIGKPNSAANCSTTTPRRRQISRRPLRSADAPHRTPTPTPAAFDVSSAVVAVGFGLHRGCYRGILRDGRRNAVRPTKVEGSSGEPRNLQHRASNLRKRPRPGYDHI